MKVAGSLDDSPYYARADFFCTTRQPGSKLAESRRLEQSGAHCVKQELPPLEPGAMSYMMSKDQYLTDYVPHNWIAHLMFYTPLMDGAVWGADVPKSPVMLNPQFNGAPEPIDVFMVPAGRWSDGTADPAQ